MQEEKSAVYTVILGVCLLLCLLMLGNMLMGRADTGTGIGTRRKGLSDMKILETSQAPGAIGPYSQAVLAGDFLYVSGQLPLDPVSGAMAGDTAAEQAEQSIRNLSAILEAAGMTLDDVVKTTVLLADIADFAAVNEVYAKHFTGAVLPARAAFAVRDLPKGAKVEIELVAYKG